MKNENLINEENLNKNEDEKIKEIINKWYILQKTIKEEITLKEMIKNQQKNYEEKLMGDYGKYYKEKLESRQIFENILIIDQNELNNLKKYNESNKGEEKLQDAFDPITKLLFLFRSNYDYILKIFSIIGEMEITNKENRKKIESLIDLFCHQFYDNILIPNPEQEELLILLYLLLEREISSMNLASCSSFLENTVIGVFLKSYTKKQELKNYLSMTLGSLILSIENDNEGCLNLNLGKIRDYVKKNINNKIKVDNNNKDINERILTKNIPHCKINFHSKLFVEEKNEDENNENNNNNNNNKNNEINYNDDYSRELTQEEIIDRIQSEKDPNLNELYNRQLEKMNRDKDVFTNKKFIQSLRNITEYKNETYKKYKENFLKIQRYIDIIIQSLIDKIATIPYPLRCICKIIYMLIKKKFPKISKYERNAFIGEFIFGKCILPILINSDINAIITSTILSRKTRDCLIEIAKVLTKINRGMFFEANLETDFTIFNHYIIEVIPIINKFYDNLIDVELPKILNVLLQKHMEKINYSEVKQNIIKRKKSYNGEKARFNFHKNIENEEKIQNEINNNNIVSEFYNYFEENKDEIFNLQCICFSIEDILFLISLLKNRINEFKNLPKFNFFNRTMERIISEEYKLEQEIINNKERNFFLIFNEEINPKYSFLLEKEKINENENEKENENEEDIDFILKKVKICIKIVLIGLNLLNSKDYPYLNIANSTKKFFSALKFTLDDYGENDEGELYNGIPLSWYSQYISNNVFMLDNKFQNNDFEELYNCLFQEENNTLNELRKYSSIIYTRFGLNQRCSEKKIEKSKKDVYKIKLIERFMKMEKFIKQEISCYIIYQNQNDRKLKLKNNEDEDSLPPIFKIQKEINNKSDNNIHLNYIETFIKIFNRVNLWKNKNCPDLYIKAKEDIESGIQRNKIYQTLNDYLDIISYQINKSDLFKNDSEEERNYIRDGIQNHILKRIYKSVFPESQSTMDKKFYEITSKLSWIKPDQLDIKKIYINELKFAEKCISKIDEGKSVNEKLKNILDAHNTINNTIKFSTGKISDAGADDLSPIFQYIIIKAKPKRFFSNINYIKCFLGPNQLKGIYGYLLSQMEFAAEFIMRIDFVKLKMSQEEFENNVQNSAFFQGKNGI